MPKSLAELRAEKSSDRPERPYKAVVGDGQKYVVEIQHLTEELDTLGNEIAVVEDRAEKQAVSRKSAQKASPELAAARARFGEIGTRLAEITDLMGEYEGELTIRATLTDGEWAAWRIAHPARDEDEPGNRDDLTITGGHCNSDDLIADLATYVVAWEGEPLKGGDYDSLNLLRPDKKAIARLVVGLYEVGDPLPKLRSDLSALLKSDDFSSLLGPSGSPRSGSSAGSRKSGTSTTTPTAD